MIKPFALMGKFALFIAGMAILTAMSLLMLGVYLASWPIMRVSPRNRKMTSLMGLAVALTAVARAYELDKFTGPSATDATDDTDESRDEPVQYPHFDGNAIVLGPEVFAADDGSVINWRGENYIPQNLDSVARKLEGGD